MTILTRRCDGVARRDLLGFTGLSLLGLSLPKYLRARELKQAITPKAKSCILIWLDGGPSHLEMFDLKPDAPSEVRGPFNAINTTVPGMEICEHLPRTAKVAKHFSIIRSMTSPLGEHGLANEYLLTGYQPSPVLSYPAYGAVLSHLRPSAAALPSYIAIPEPKSSHGAGFLGSSYEAFKIAADPSRGAFEVRDLAAFPGVDAERIARRREYLAEFDRAQAAIEASPQSTEGKFEKAFGLVTSPKAKAAFDLQAESQQTRLKYGSRTIGQSSLLARRLIEADVPFVTVYNPGWDTHANLDLQLRAGFAGAKEGVGLIPNFDLAFSALIEDLAQSGRLEETLVVAMGEFGRTPKLNSNGGRDHWPRVFSVAMAGGGVRGGQVIGSSDRVGESPKDDPVTPVDLACTIYTLLGIDPTYELQTSDGRPVPVNQGGKVIKQLLA
jgi:hypothetical protein